MLQKFFLFFCLIVVVIACSDDDSSGDYLACSIDGTRITFNCGFTNDSWPRTAWASKQTSTNDYVIIGTPLPVSMDGVLTSYLIIGFHAVTNSSGEFTTIDSVYFDILYNGTGYTVDSHTLLIYDPPGIGGTLEGSFNLTAHAGTTNITVTDGLIHVPRTADGIIPPH